MEIYCKALSTCEVVPNGDAILLGFIDANGSPITLRFSSDQTSALLMTLPGLIDTALQRSLKDPSLRYAYPLTSWRLEQSSDPLKCMVTLRTQGGFSACFSVTRSQQVEIGEALVRQLPSDITRHAN
jgi:hypothetical protein